MSELEIWNELGNIYFNTGAYDEAIRTYQKAIELDHGCGQSYSNLASIFVRQGHCTDAIPMLQKGIELLDEAASQAVLWNQLGEAYFKLDDYNNAIAAYRKAAELDPENTAYQDNLAEIELAWQRLDSQSVNRSSRSEKNPGLSHVYADVTESGENPSWVFKNHGLVYPAEEYSSRASKVSPVILGSRVLSDAPGKDKNSGNSAKLADASSSAGKPEGMVTTNLRADGLLMLGIKHWRRKEYERAIHFLETALDTVIRPKDNFLEALCYYAIAQVKTDLGKIVEAIQAHQSAASLAPESIFPWNNLGNLNCMLDQYDDALAAFREAIEHNPKDPASWNGLGDVYHKLGRNEEAIAAYQRGNVYEKQFLDEDVLTTYERKIKESLKHPEVWNEAGNIYYDNGDYEDAITSCSKAIELDPANANYHANLMKAEQVLGKDHTRNKAPVSEKSSTLPDRTANSESEAAYWIFEPDPAQGNVLQPAPQDSSIVAKTGVSDIKPLPAYSTRPSAKMTAGAQLIQLTPRPAKQIDADEKILTPLEEDNSSCASADVHSEMRNTSACTTEVQTGNPALQPVTTGNLNADQTPIDFHVLENDITAYRRVTELNPRNDRAWDALGNMYESACLHSEAIAAFEQAIALAPRKEAYHYHLAIALAYQMHYDQAIQVLQDVIALNPNFVLGHCALASNYRRVGNETAAQEHIAIARPSMEYEKEYNRACFESISGNTDQAFALLEIAREKQQIQIAMLRTDPDLDFIRSDARFEELLQTISQVN